MSDHLQLLRDRGKVRPRRMVETRLDRTAWITGIPLVVLVLAALGTYGLLTAGLLTSPR